MVATRRVGTTTSKTRARLLDLTEQMMLEEGYAAVSSRSLAARAGVKAPLVHYYFPSLDDLFIAAFRRRSERNLERLANALQGDDPLQALWDYANDKTHVALTLEFLALANHRKAIQAELAEVAERFRKVELEAFTPVAASSGIDLDEFPPDALLLIMMAIPTTVVLEESFGMSTGHEHALMLVERSLSQLRGTPLRRRTATEQTALSTKKSTKSSKKATKSTKTAAKPIKKASKPRRRRS
jgi:AcrR family transcriptional regulator